MLAQLVTGFWAAAALKRLVLPTIQAVRMPPPDPPVTNRLFGSTAPLAMAASTAAIRSAKSLSG